MAEQVTEDAVAMLEEMGFGRAESRVALRNARGEVSTAMWLLLNPVSKAEQEAAFAEAAGVAEPGGAAASSSSSAAAAAPGPARPRGEKRSRVLAAGGGGAGAAGPARLRGQVISCSDAGWGFIEQADKGAANIFYHVHDLRGDTGVVLCEGDRVSFTITYDPVKNKSRATDVDVELYSPAHPVAKRERVRGGKSTKRRKGRRSPRRRYSEAPPPAAPFVEPPPTGPTATVTFLERHYGLMRTSAGEQAYFEVRHVAAGTAARLVVGAIVEYEPRTEPVVGPTARNLRVLRGVRPHSADHLSYGAEIKCDEDRENEFKALSTTVNPVFTAAQYCKKYISAFLNTSGGRLFFGVVDNGRVRGVQLNRESRDKLRLAIDHVVRCYTPSVGPDMYDVEFVPVCRRIPQGVLPLADLFVVRVTVQRAPPGRVYVAGDKKAYYRMDGSAVEMPADMLIDRTARGGGGGGGGARGVGGAGMDIEAAVARAVERQLAAAGAAPSPRNGYGGAGGGGGVVLSDDVVQACVAMGFERAAVLEACYDLSRAGNARPDAAAVIQALTGE